MRLPTAAATDRRSALGSALLALSCTTAPPALLLRSGAAHAATTADRVDTATGKLILNRPPTINVRETPPKVTSRCYLDVSISGERAGRLDIELYGEVAPKAAENFRALCTGEKGFGYSGSSFYKLVEGLALQGGDVSGKGEGRSIYGEPFEHDGYDIMHNVVGLVSMVNSGVGGSSGTSDSRFLIQPIADAGFLDGRYEAFGRVYGGLEVLRMIEAVPTGGTKKAPKQKIIIEAAGTLVPPGVRIKWFQRKETIWIDIEAPDIQVDEVTWDDSGLIQVKAKDPMQCLTLQMLHRIHTCDSRWWVSGRYLKMEVAKAEYGLAHWDRLTVGEKLPNVLIDWTSWIDEAEENEIRNSPYGHDARSMASAMGKNWGSNVDRSIKAKAQAQKVDTSNPDDEDDEITMA